MRIVANLDCELTWAGGPALPARVRAKLGALGTLLRALAPREPADVDDDVDLVLCAPVERARIPDHPFAPRWREVSGEDDDGRADLRWGAPPSDAIRRVADRRFALAVREQLGVALAGARAVASVDELEAHVATLASAGAHAWVAKAPITAAGRDRVRRRGPLDDATRARATRLLARGGALVVEPWLDRIADFGQSAAIAPSGELTLRPPHRLLVDDGGGFAGIAPERNDAGDADDALRPDEHAELARVARATGAALADAGYAGPFTIDAFAYRDAAGARRFHPLCEINPRLTFGVVARAWAERLGAPCTLRIGDAAPPGGAIALVLPTAADPTAAWLERMAS